MDVYFNEFMAIMTIHFIALLSPGADFVYLLNSALSNRVKVAIGASLGIALSNGFYILLCLLGYATIFSQSTLLLVGIKIIGGFYLLYLGVQIVKSKSISLKATKTSNNSFLKEVIRGFYISFLNPKISLFYISLFTLVISKSTPFYIQLAYGAWMFLLVFIWDTLLVILIGKKGFKDKILSLSKINFLLGSLLIIMGLSLFYSLLV